MNFTIINALSWDLDFEDFAFKSIGKTDIRIHSIFKRVINIITDDKLLYTISNINTDNAPYTLKMDFTANFNEIIAKDDKIIFNEENIIIGNILINLSNVVLWDSAIKVITDYSSLNIYKNIETFNRMIIESGENGGCKDYYLKRFLNINGHTASPIEEHLYISIGEFYKHLSGKTLKKDHIRNLIGLGIGLTPSGDDFLNGFLASIGIFKTNKDLHKRISEWIYPLLASTTDISIAMLKAAIESKYRESLSDFIYSFLESDKEDFIRCFNNLLSIGSSSGTDLSIGVVLGLKYTLKE